MTCKVSGLLSDLRYTSDRPPSSSVRSVAPKALASKIMLLPSISSALMMESVMDEFGMLGIKKENDVV